MPAAVVIDASLAAMWAIPEPHTEQALALASRWIEAGTRLLAPCLLIAELTNALYKRVVREEMDLPTAQAALDIVLRFSIDVQERPGLGARAMALAQRLRRPTTYDCHYLALAEHYGCELWTGDERFFNAVHRQIPWIRWVAGTA
jgi:predicted nucleic acid-binding protein